MQRKERIVAVFGGAGFVGRGLCRRLAAEGYSVRGVSRSGAPGDPRFRAGTEWTAADLFDAPVRGALCAGAFAVVDCVGVLFEGRTRESSYRRAIYGACRALAGEAIAQGVPGFVFVSAVKPPPGPLARYGAYKRLSERWLARRFPSALVLRPGVVAGPGKPLVVFAAAVEGALRRLPPLGRLPRFFTPAAELEAAVVAYLAELEERCH